MKSRPGARAAFTVNAVLAWCGVVLVSILSVADQYTAVTPDRGMYGDNPAGAAGAWGRLFDTLSYFTVWSNIVVALSVTLLALGPGADSTARRVLRVDALIMITVTAIVYALVLSPGSDPTGWDRLTNPLQHIVVPAVTLVVWCVWGPRGRISLRTVALSFVVPAVWIGFMLLRGAVIHAYPYPFVNVEEQGYGATFVALFFVLLFGIALALLFWWLGRMMTRRRNARSHG